MMKHKMVTCLTILVLVAAVAGVFCYIAYARQNNGEKRGTLVRAFSQKVNECCI